jgi:hypothetical protein
MPPPPPSTMGNMNMNGGGTMQQGMLQRNHIRNNSKLALLAPSRVCIPGTLYLFLGVFVLYLRIKRYCD